VGLFLFFVILAGHGTSSSSTPPRGNLARVAGGAAGKGAGADLAARRRPDGEPRLFTARVVQEFPHDAQAFTQGLQFDRICRCLGLPSTAAPGRSGWEGTQAGS
jgi:hypothetical protein